MKYVKVQNNQPQHYTLEQLFQEHPDAVIYKKSKMPNEQLLANYNVFPLITTDRPRTSEDSVAEEGTPNKIGNRWYQTWVIRQLTEQEVNDIIAKTKETYDNFSDVTDEDQSFLADKETQINRLNICKACPSFTNLKTCKECGCIMPLKVKISSSKCPINKW